MFKKVTDTINGYDILELEYRPYRDDSASFYTYAVAESLPGTCIHGEIWDIVQEFDYRTDAIDFAFTL